MPQVYPQPNLQHIRGFCKKEGLLTRAVHTGPRSAKAMADSALALLPDTFITGLKGASALEKFKEASEMPKVILASTKSRATPLYRASVCPSRDAWLLLW